MSPHSEGRITVAWAQSSGWFWFDQKPIGPYATLESATYKRLFDHVRRIFAETKAARARHYTAGRFSFQRSPRAV